MLAVAWGRRAAEARGQPGRPFASPQSTAAVQWGSKAAEAVASQVTAAPLLPRKAQLQRWPLASHPKLRRCPKLVLAVVRDLPDLQRVALLFSQRLLCLSPSPLHASAGRRPSSGRGGSSSEPLTPADLAVEVCAALFRGRHTAQLAAVQRLLPAGSQDSRLLFFRVRVWGRSRVQGLKYACSCLLMTSSMCDCSLHRPFPLFVSRLSR